MAGQPKFPLEFYHLKRIISLKFPTIQQRNHILQRLINVRASANESFRIGPIANNNPINLILKFIRTGAKASDERDSVS